MTRRKAIAILRTLRADRLGSLKGVDGFRKWDEATKDLARKIIRDDAEALQLAIEALKNA